MLCHFGKSCNKHLKIGTSTSLMIFFSLAEFCNKVFFIFFIISCDGGLFLFFLFYHVIDHFHHPTPLSYTMMVFCVPTLINSDQNVQTYSMRLDNMDSVKVLSLCSVLTFSKELIFIVTPAESLLILLMSLMSTHCRVQALGTAKYCVKK